MKKLNLTEATVKALENKLIESIDEDSLIDVHTVLNDMMQKADEIYDLWVSINPSIRENLDVQFDDNANISYCIRWLTQALNDVTSDWENVKTDLMKNSD